MKCLVVANTMCGNYSKSTIDTVVKEYSAKMSVDVKYVTKPSDKWTADGYDTVVVCGGDGTLSNAINTCNKSDVNSIVYVACGTFNECAADCHRCYAKIGKAADRNFSYVLAHGTCCEIGYETSNREKKKLKVFAYLKHVFKYFTTRNFNIKIVSPDFCYSGKASLVMFINSSRCFGFRFNRIYNHTDNNLYLLVVKGFEKNNLINRIKLFFPMFRAFFIGFGKPRLGKSLIFTPFEKANVEFDCPTEFCMDGEKITMPDQFEVSSDKTKFRLKILQKQSVKATRRKCLKSNFLDTEKQ
ncbi:MAG: hypothetical protein NC350_02365 [Corallococcus sp.]|nr:hypothetical protein [Corallococcus sp.]